MVLETRAGATVVSEPRDSPWGRRAVVDDPEGQRVELVSVVDEAPSRS
jgi:predicted enzyme related to lactoylglutathione lyase